MKAILFTIALLIASAPVHAACGPNQVAVKKIRTVVIPSICVPHLICPALKDIKDGAACVESSVKCKPYTPEYETVCLWVGEQP